MEGGSEGPDRRAGLRVALLLDDRDRLILYRSLPPSVRHVGVNVDDPAFTGDILAALEADFDTLYSEDLQHNQKIEGRLRIVNPFR